MGAVSKLPVHPLQEKHEEVYLTNSQAIIMSDLLSGVGIEEMAKKHGIGYKAMKIRLSKIYLAFGVTSRISLIELAISDGIHYRCRMGSKAAYHIKLSICERKF